MSKSRIHIIDYDKSLDSKFLDDCLTVEMCEIENEYLSDQTKLYHSFFQTYENIRTPRIILSLLTEFKKDYELSYSNKELLSLINSINFCYQERASDYKTKTIIKDFDSFSKEQLKFINFLRTYRSLTEKDKFNRIKIEGINDEFNFITNNRFLITEILDVLTSSYELDQLPSDESVVNFKIIKSRKYIADFYLVALSKILNQHYSGDRILRGIRFLFLLSQTPLIEPSDMQISSDYENLLALCDPKAVRLKLKRADLSTYFFET